MVKAAKAFERIEAGTGIPRVTIERAAYILRTAGGDLFPTGGPGGGRVAPRPTVPHLVNLALAIYAADPLIEAPDLVRRYRDLVPASTSRLSLFGMFGLDPEAWDRSEEAVTDLLDHFCPGATLGDMLDGLVSYLVSAEHPTMREERREFARKYLKSLTVWRFRFRGGAIGASLETSAGGRSFREPIGGLLPLMEDGLEDRHIPPAAALYPVIIPFAIFEILADLARDDAPGRKTSSSVAGGAAAQDVQTTTPAAGGAGPASVNKAGQPGGNPVNPAEPNTQQDSGRKKRGQRPPPSAPRGSPSSGQKDQPKEEPPWQ